MAMLLRKIILFAMILSGTAMAINFGSTTKGSLAQIEENGTAEFSLVFWSSDTENHTILISVRNNPDNLDVAILNNKITISALTGNEFVYSAGNYIRATSVGITVNNTPRGEHIIIVSAKTAESGSGQIKVLQERLFNLTVISGELQPRQDDTSPTVPVIPTPLPETGPNNYNYMLAIIAVILIVSFAIYKYS